MGRAQTKETKEKISRSQSNYWGKKIKKCRVCSKKLNSTNKSGYCKTHLYVSEGYKNNLSRSLKGKAGGYREGSGRSKGEYYKGSYFDSPFEIEIAKRLDELNIIWKRNTKRFYFIHKGKKTYYIPDFYINEDFYLETKGYWYGDKEIRTLEAVKQNKINWKLLMQKDWIEDNSILERMMAHSSIG